VNLLAHAFLANGDPNRIVGQLCGDFVRGADLAQFPTGIQSGILCHRAVDSFTDQHPTTLQAKRLFKPPHRRYAGIVIDVAYDHFLASDWSAFSKIPLDEYTQGVYRSLRDQQALLPPAMQRLTRLLEQEDTLSRNTERAHIDLTIKRIAARRERLSALAHATDALWAVEPQLKDVFYSFFPQLVSYTREFQTEQIDGLR